MRTKLFLAALAVFPFASKAQSSLTIGNTTLQVDTLVSGLDIPWEIIWGPDNHIWMTERRGRVSRINPANGQVTVILNHQSAVWQNSESGMLGMALHPNFPSSPYVYIPYTYGTSASNAKEKLVRFEWDGTNLANETILLDNIPANSTHIGARLLFLPDGTLLMTTGDAQNQPSAQDLNALSGKVLRLNQDGTIPNDNPLGADSYVYALGLRNAQGMLSLGNGKIFLSEHGPNTDDEFMELIAGRNYGWPTVQGFCETAAELQFCQENNVVEPLVAWTPTIAPSDMVYYENPMFPEWHNKILMTVLKDRMLVALELNAAMDAVVSQTQYLENLYGRLRDICIGPNKEIYLATNGPFWSNSQPNTHTIVRLTPPSSGANLENPEQDDWSLFPNPANQSIYIQGLAWDAANIRIVDNVGRTVIQFDHFASGSVDVSALKSGSYFLTVETGEFSKTKPFMIQK